MHAGHIAYLIFFGMAALWLFLTPEFSELADRGEVPDYCISNSNDIPNFGDAAHDSAVGGRDVSGRSH